MSRQDRVLDTGGAFPAQPRAWLGLPVVDRQAGQVRRPDCQRRLGLVRRRGRLHLLPGMRVMGEQLPHRCLMAFCAALALAITPATAHANPATNHKSCTELRASLHEWQAAESEYRTRHRSHRKHDGHRFYWYSRLRRAKERVAALESEIARRCSDDR